MTDPYIAQILRDAQDDSNGNGGAISLIILIAFFCVCGLALWLTHGGKF